MQSNSVIKQTKNLRS